MDQSYIDIRLFEVNENQIILNEIITFVNDLLRVK